MNLGTNEPKKVVVLSVLGLVAAYLVYSNLFSNSPGAPAARTPAPAADPSPAPTASPSPEPVRTFPRTAASRGRSDEFHPVLHSKRPEDRIDPMRIDPTLRLDLLAKLEKVESPGTGRNVFQFGAAPAKVEPLKGPEPKVIPKPPLETKNEPPKPPPPPPPAPITLRYYGFSSAPGNSTKTAFFLDGEDILVAKEGETVKRRYRVVRIGINSVVMEDTESKRQQTLPLAEELAG